jgi:hypothetical protein
MANNYRTVKENVEIIFRGLRFGVEIGMTIGP